MKMLCHALLPINFIFSVHAASVEDILNYDLQGISLAQPFGVIQTTLQEKDFKARSWPRHNPDIWKFEKKNKFGSEIYEVRLDRDGKLKSIRYQKSVHQEDQQVINMEAAYNMLSGMATGSTDDCRKFLRGGFQCMLHAGHGGARINLSARTGRGSVSITVSR